MGLELPQWVNVEGVDEAGDAEVGPVRKRPLCWCDELCVHRVEVAIRDVDGFRQRCQVDMPPPCESVREFLECALLRIGKQKSAESLVGGELTAKLQSGTTSPCKDGSVKRRLLAIANF